MLVKTWREILDSIRKTLSIGKMSAKSRGRRGLPTATPESLESRIVPADVVSILGTGVTGATSVNYTVTFDQNVVGVDGTDFRLTTSGSVVADFPPVVTPAAGPASVYTVTVNNIHGNGELRLDLIDNDSIFNSPGPPTPGNALGGAGVNNGSFQGQTFQILQGLPAVLSINRTGAANPPAGTTTASFNVVFNKPVKGVTQDDFVPIFTGTAAGNANLTLTGGGANYTVTVTGITGVGDVGVNLVDNGSIQDLAGNPLVQSLFFPSYAAAQAVTIGRNPDVVEMADLNSDGLVDLITGNTADRSVSVALGNGNGTFQPVQTFATAPGSGGPTSLAVRDVNRDGQFDVVTTNKLSSSLSVLLGNGDGTLQPHLTFNTTATNPSSVALEDLDSDGKPDLVVTGEVSNVVDLYRGNGNGTFVGAGQLATGTQPSAVLLRDLTGDGESDLIITNLADNTVTVRRNTGDLTFNVPISTTATDTGPSAVAVGDFNADGRPDLVTANKGGNSVTVLLGLGGGAFTAQPPIFTGAASGPTGVAVNDVNGDGRVDIVVANSGTNTVGILVGNGNGSFQDQLTFAAGTGPGNVVLTDLNRDGRLDFVASSTANRFAYGLANTQRGDFAGEAYTFAATVANPPVIITPPTASVDENTPANTVILDVNATDADVPAQVLTYTLTGLDAGRFNINTATGEIRFNSSSDFELPTDAGGNNVYDVIVTVNDGNRGITPQNIAITVRPLNDNTPVFTSPATGSVNENTPPATVVLVVNATDADLPPQVLGYTLSGADAGLFNINNATGVITFLASPDFDVPADANRDNIYSLVVTVTDNAPLAPRTATQTVAITVLNANDAPTDIALSPATVAGNQPAGTFVGTFSTTDRDTGDVFTYALVPGPGGADNASFSVAGNQLTTTGPLGAGGKTSYAIRVRSTDSGGLNTEKAFTVTSRPLNNNDPVINSAATASVAENTATATVVLDVNATDADLPPQTLSYSLSGSDAGAFNINGATGQITFKVSPDFETPADAGGDNVYNLIVTVLDDVAPIRATTQNLVITVLPVNDNSPVITTTATASVDENSPAGIVLLDVNAIDADLPAQSLTYSLTGADAALFNVNATTGEITLKASPDFEQPTDAGRDNKFDLTVTVTDSVAPARAISQAVVITVNNVNEVPVAADGVLTALEEIVASGRLTGSDVDAGDTLTFTILKQPAHGTATLIDARTGDYTYKSDLNYNGPDSFTIQATDGKLDSNVATVQVTVTPVNDPPTAQDAVLSIPENSPAGTPVATIAAADPDAGDTLTFAIASGNTGGTFVVDPVTGVISVADNVLLDFEKPLAFDLVVTATDSAGVVATASIAITITNIDEPLVVTLPGATTIYCTNGGPVAIEPAASADDPDTPIFGYNEGTLTVTSESLGAPAEHDVLGVITQGNGKGKVSEQFGNLVYESSLVIIGRIISGRDGGPLVISLTSFSAPDAVNVLLSAISFSNNATVPELGMRRITFHLTDKTGAEQDIETKLLNVVTCETTDGLTLPGDEVAYVNKSAPVAVDATATVNIPGLADFRGSRLTVAITAGAVSQNRLSLLTAEGITLKGSNVLYQGLKIGKLTKKTNLWRIDLNTKAATPDAVQALARSIAFATSASNRNLADRVFQFTLTDNKKTAHTATQTVHVI